MHVFIHMPTCVLKKFKGSFSRSKVIARETKDNLEKSILSEIL